MAASLTFLGLNPLFVSPRRQSQAPKKHRIRISSPPKKKSLTPSIAKCLPFPSNSRSSKMQQIGVPKTKLALSRSRASSRSKSKSKSKDRKKPRINKEDSKLRVQLLHDLKPAPNDNLQPGLENNKSHSSETSDAESSRSSVSSFAQDPNIDRDPPTLGAAADDELPDLDASERVVFRILTKQRNEAVQYAQKLEKELKDKELQFTLKLSALEQELKEYKHTKDALQEQNVKCKQEIQALKQKLVCSKKLDDSKKAQTPQSQTVDGLLRKRPRANAQNKRKQLPNYVLRQYAEKTVPVSRHNTNESTHSNSNQSNVGNHSEITTPPTPAPTNINVLSLLDNNHSNTGHCHINVELEHIDISNDGSDCDSTHHREEDLNDDCNSNEDGGNDNDHDDANVPQTRRGDRPFIHRRSMTESSEGSSESSLSQHAVNLSFPQLPDPLSHHRQLTTILEHQSIPLNLIELPLHNLTPNSHDSSLQSLHSSQSVDAEEDAEEEQMEAKNSTDKDASTDTDDAPTIHTLHTSVASQDAGSPTLSYMSNNTQIMNELNMSSSGQQQEGGTLRRGHSKTPSTLHQANDSQSSTLKVVQNPLLLQVSHSSRMSEHDLVIASPININDILY